MKFDVTFFRKKVARRIVLLFVLCALVPIVTLAIISFSLVTKQLKAQSQERLRQASKTRGMAIYGRLQLLEAELKIVASRFSTTSGVTLIVPSEGLPEDIEQHFDNLAVFMISGKYTPLFGRIEKPKLTAAEEQHISSGGTFIFTKYRTNLSSQIFMSRTLGPKQQMQGILVAEVNADYVMGLSTASSFSELYVLDHSNNMLYGSLQVPASFVDQIGAKSTPSTSGVFEWKNEGKLSLAPELVL